MKNRILNRGALIVIEGPDNAGKTTQCELLANEFLIKNLPVKIQKFPDRSTEIGKIINSYLSGDLELEDHAIHLLFSANRWEISEKVRKNLEEGTFVIADRYIYSGIAFSVAKGLDIEWCKAPERGLPLPDCVIYLDVDQEKTSQRQNYGTERYETKVMQENVRSIFKDISEANNNVCCPWYWINASNSVLQVKTEIWNAVHEIINNNMNKIHEFY
ncbi:thymidylate kinase [Pneumocystis jirovecii RU7]|uniref:Thymidylate kinase n=1 Tax=Pneumocystis jirovecii (strain RU7) TaxID=1408657 RepID=A0A0W4ZVI4_PNEJ7|nr:thymidylate kinase [Pneumocystis jirovecii RU7]KTW32385.1 thymidylate kinase [Pneumocystis jirovecii RU7]